jgi:hypothetical protein
MKGRTENRSSAGFQTCRIADFQVGKVLGITQFAGLETRDTADLEVCATVVVYGCALLTSAPTILNP